jgi:hypothetical protein
MSTTTLTDVEREAIRHAVEAEPETFIEPLEVATVNMVKALTEGDDDTEVEALVALVDRIRKARA